jgi:hypothetical protein
MGNNDTSDILQVLFIWKLFRLRLPDLYFDLIGRPHYTLLLVKHLYRQNHVSLMLLSCFFSGVDLEFVIL